MAWTHQHQHGFDDNVPYNVGHWTHDPSLYDPCLHITSMERYIQDNQDPWHMRQPVAPHFESSPLQPLAPSLFHGETYVQRVSSPSDSTPSSIDAGSGLSDYHRESTSSPPFRAATYVPDVSSMHITSPYFNSHHDIHAGGGGVVALHDVQFNADCQPEAAFFEEDQSTMFFSGPSAAEEGYQPRVDTAHYDNSEIKCEIEHVETVPVESNESETAPPNIRQRRPSRSRTITSPVMSSRVTKRPSGTRRRSSSSIKSPTKDAMESTASNRSFPCVFVKYGCPSTFGSKNEWKRHVITQHMRPGFWRCDLCESTPDRKPNDFNRKDLFIQHVRRMHDAELHTTHLTSRQGKGTSGGSRSPKTSPEDHHLAAVATRCYKSTRSLPEESGCYFCDARFKGKHSWEERMEHVGTHLETRKREGGEVVDPATWRDDVVVEEYLKREGIVERRGRGWGLVGLGVGK